MITLQPERRTIPAVRLFAAVSMGLVLSLLFAGGHVSADSRRPPAITGPPAGLAAPWDFRQQAVVAVEVNVRSVDDAALMQSLGYTCGTGVCALELRHALLLASHRSRCLRQQSRAAVGVHHGRMREALPSGDYQIAVNRQRSATAGGVARRVSRPGSSVRQSARHAVAS